MKKNLKGFTLIELLVVISIIGLLSTMAVISLNGAREKARDAQRLSDVKQLSTLFEVENAQQDPDTAITGCTLTADLLSTLCAYPGDIVLQAANFTDPVTATAATACTSATAAGDLCGYSVSMSDGSLGATLNDYQICFKTEADSTIGAAGLHSVLTGGVMTPGCL